MMPGFGSPALGVGTYQTGEPATDQRGYARPASGAIDLGSVQVSGSGATVTAISPMAGTIMGGTTVTITGTGFTSATEVYFGDVGASSFTVNSATSITATAPAAAVGTVDIEVVTPVGISGAVSADKYTYSSIATILVSPSVSLTENHAGASFAPVIGTGGTTPLSYSVSPTLPAGLSMATLTGAISGIPTVTAGAAAYTVTVTDAHGATATASFSLTVDSAVTATQSVAAAVLTQNHGVTPFTPVTGAGGAAPLSYSVSPALPAGLSMAPSTGAISGTATVTANAATYTVTVTDANGATATASFTLTVEGALTATQSVATTALTQSHAALPFTPVTGAGGTTPLSYSVSPALPAGLSMAPATGVISGMPTATSPTTTYTVTVTDANGATATATFSMTVDSVVVATRSVAAVSLTESHAVPGVVPVSGSGGTVPLAYSLSPALPAGLSYSSSTGTITGTPTATSPATTYTVTVTDANGAVATAQFTMTVSAPVAATLNNAAVSLTESHAVTALLPVSGTGGTAPLTYSVSPALPAGLSYSSSTGAITGTPTAASPVTTYTVTVTDANGATAMANFILTVNSAVVAKQNTASQSLTENQPATSFTPVSSTGGTAPLTYSISPATLPAGLTFSPSTGTITGTPTASSPATTYTVTVTDANGAATSASFSLTVNGAVTSTQSAAPTALTYGQSATFKPVNGAGGTGTLTYTIAPALPTGLSYSQSTGTITGVATAVTAATTYTVTVTDTNRATTTATFSLAINQATVSGVLFTSTVNPVLFGSTTTLVATISSSVSTPTGTVSFIDASSSTPLGSATLSGGVAQLPVSNLAVGTHSITAVYSGDTDFLGATSTAWSEQVGDFSLSVASAGSGTSDGSAMISPGGTANYGLTLAPTGTTSLVAGVTLSVTGLPPGATYTLTPNSVAAGAETTNVQLSVSMPSQTAALQHHEPFRGGLVSVALGMLLLPFSRRMRRSASRFGRMAAVLLLLIAGAAGVAGLTGCGASTGFFGQAQQTYNVTVVATSGTLTHSTIVTLTVE